MAWFVALPLAVQISVGISFILLVGVLGFLGKVNLKIGKNIITSVLIEKKNLQALLGCVIRNMVLCIVRLMVK